MTGRYTYRHQQEGLDIIHWSRGSDYDKWQTLCSTYEVHDTEGRLVYVGIADNFESRWAQHVKRSWWLGEIDVDYIIVRGYPSRLDARCHEAITIHYQQPIYNTAQELPTLQIAMTSWKVVWPLEETTYIYARAGELNLA